MTAYWGAGDGEWFSDAERARDLTRGWAAACEECRVSWGGGETQVLPSLIEAGKVKPVIYKTFPAAQAAQAHALMESSVHVGKIVLDWTKT